MIGMFPINGDTLRCLQPDLINKVMILLIAIFNTKSTEWASIYSSARAEESFIDMFRAYSLTFSSTQATPFEVTEDAFRTLSPLGPS